MRPIMILVTPSRALAWLRGDDSPVDLDRVARYAAVMDAGAWEDRPEHPIVVDENDRLIEGHHRMRAIVQLASPVRCAVELRGWPARRAAILFQS